MIMIRHTHTRRWWRRSVLWEEKNFRVMPSTSIWIKRSKGKKFLIEDNITRYVDTPGGNIETFYAFMKWTIAKKNGLFGPKSEFAFIIGMKVGPAGITKNTK
jgi:hypothetical protein